MDTQVREFLDYLDSAHSVYHAQAGIRKLLDEAGYTFLRESQSWDLQPGGKYYTQRGGSAVMAFRIPEKLEGGFLMAAAHCDRPSFKVKENGELTGTYTRLATEKYGGMLMAPWLDRPLSIAGRVLVETENGVESRLLDIDRYLMLIPNVAIHMNRKANDGYTYNPTCDTVPLLGSKNAAGKLEKLLEQEAGGKILGHDLYLYIRQKAAVWGIDEEFISSAALDDLQCVWCCTQGFLKAQASGAIPVLCIFDSEEVGSNSTQGAASTLLEDTLGRIAEGLHMDLRQMLAKSFMVSADNAHAVHPNHPEYADPQNAPVAGSGVVLKFNAAQHYTTDGVSAAIFRSACKKAGVKVQTFYNRADLPGGSTLGHISICHVSVPTADIGMAQLAMHSCYETAAVQDVADLCGAMEAYYGLCIQDTETGYTLG